MYEVVTNFLTNEEQNKNNKTPSNAPPGSSPGILEVTAKMLTVKRSELDRIYFTVLFE